MMKKAQLIDVPQIGKTTTGQKTTKGSSNTSDPKAENSIFQQATAFKLSLVMPPYLESRMDAQDMDALGGEKIKLSNTTKCKTQVFSLESDDEASRSRNFISPPSEKKMEVVRETST